MLRLEDAQPNSAYVYCQTLLQTLNRPIPTLFTEMLANLKDAIHGLKLNSDEFIKTAKTSREEFDQFLRITNTSYVAVRFYLNDAESARQNLEKILAAHRFNINALCAYYESHIYEIYTFVNNICGPNYAALLSYEHVPPVSNVGQQITTEKKRKVPDEDVTFGSTKWMSARPTIRTFFGNQNSFVALKTDIENRNLGLNEYCELYDFDPRRLKNSLWVHKSSYYKIRFDVWSDDDLRKTLAGKLNDTFIEERLHVPPNVFKLYLLDRFDNDLTRLHINAECIAVVLRKMIQYRLTQLFGEVDTDAKLIADIKQKDLPVEEYCEKNNFDKVGLQSYLVRHKTSYTAVRFGAWSPQRLRAEFGSELESSTNKSKVCRVNGAFKAYLINRFGSLQSLFPPKSAPTPPLPAAATVPTQGMYAVTPGVETERYTESIDEDVSRFLEL